jgi:hypothetical protein
MKTEVNEKRNLTSLRALERLAFPAVDRKIIDRSAIVAKLCAPTHQPLKFTVANTAAPQQLPNRPSSSQVQLQVQSISLPHHVRSKLGHRFTRFI